MKIRLLICCTLFTLWAASASATCSPSTGLAIACTSGTTAAQVNTAISGASDGAVITFASGSYSGLWSLTSAKGVTLICDTLVDPTDGTSIPTCTHSGQVQMGTYSGINNKLYRISGFNFTANTFGVIWFCSASGCNGSFSQVRIDHNRFTSQTSSVIYLGENTSSGQFYGVIDHNYWVGANNVLAITMFGSDHAPWVASSLGTGNNMFIENNRFNFTTQSNNGDGCIDGWSAQAFVARYNTAHNCRLISHGVCHGGPMNFELYHNTVDTNDGFRLIHHQGSGTMMVWSNTLSPLGNTPIALLYYRDDSSLVAGSCSGKVTDTGANLGTTCNGSAAIDQNRPGQTGYSCYHQPGRDKDQNLLPIYVWDNHNPAGAQAPFDVTATHTISDRDYFEAVSPNAQTSATAPFNGSTGMGFGTLARRPTTCSVAGTDASDAGNGGVGYFATDSGPQGTLYRCSATNTWTAYYQPYTYPHPLAGGVTSTPSISTPAMFSKHVDSHGILSQSATLDGGQR